MAILCSRLAVPTKFLFRMSQERVEWPCICGALNGESTPSIRCLLDTAKPNGRHCLTPPLGLESKDRVYKVRGLLQSRSFLGTFFIAYIPFLRFQELVSCFLLFFYLLFFALLLTSRQARHTFSFISFKMKFTNVVLAASAASLAYAYPRGRDVIPNKRNVSQRASNGFTCTFDNV